MENPSPVSADDAANVGSLLDPGRWVELHGDPLYRFALAWTGHAELAAELVQEAFLEGLRCRDSFSGRSSERTWLVGILKHKILDHLRRSRRERRLGDSGGRDGPHEPIFDRDGRWVRPPRPWKGDAVHELERREFWEAVNSCIASLPGHLGEAFLLRELEGLSGEAVCRRAGITPANLWARLHRARLALRQCLDRKGMGRRDDGGPQRDGSRP